MPGWIKGTALMQRISGIYRLWLEPGRLWKRYLVTNTAFMLLYAKRSFQR
jgi:UDP-N-acetyl-D-mannosaminuronic acid transferase (WecB/TagA/CpsF family)